MQKQQWIVVLQKKPIEDFDKYENELAARLDQSMNFMRAINSDHIRAGVTSYNKQSIEFESLKAAIAFKDSGLGEPILAFHHLKESLKKTILIKLQGL